MDQKQLAILCVFGTAAWVIWLIFSVVRQYLLTRSQAEAQDRLLSRVGSPESLQVFLASESGREFLRRLEPDPNDAWRAIIRSAQTATIYAAGAGQGIQFACGDAAGIRTICRGASPQVSMAAWQ